MGKIKEGKYIKKKIQEKTDNKRKVRLIISRKRIIKMLSNILTRRRMRKRRKWKRRSK